MMKRMRLIIILVIILLGSLLALYLHQDREPSYQGRKLSEWLEDHSYQQRRTKQDTALLIACTNAVRQIGTNAIPFLLKSIPSKDGEFKKRIKFLLGRQSVIRFHFKDEDEEAGLVYAGFCLLGKDARSAVPALVALTKDPDSLKRLVALCSLAAVEPSKEILVPILLSALNDRDNEVNIVSVELLHEWFPEEAEKAGLYKKFPGLKESTTHTIPTNAPAVQ
jgi:hypothetical protein